MKTSILIITAVLTVISFNKIESNNPTLERIAYTMGENTTDDQCKYTFTTNWERIEVEVRAGNQYNCGEKGFVDSFILYEGESKVLYANGQLCYRRKARPNDSNSNWANWTSSVMCLNDREIKIQVR